MSTNYFLEIGIADCVIIIDTVETKKIIYIIILEAIVEI